jgi:flagellar basal body rod protein FlgF
VLKTVNIGGTFLFCGSLAIEQNLNVNSDGLMTVNGSFVFGQYKKNTSLNVDSQSKLQLHGNAVIYGDLKLNSGSTLEFLGEGNTITVHGTVTVNSGAQIIGNYTDTEGKLK